MTSMKTMRFPRLRLLLPVLALMALSLAGCVDSGDTPAGPGAGGPLVNEGTAGITATAENTSPGGSFTIIGYFNDGNGQPVAGTAIVAGSEGDVGFFDDTDSFLPFFSFGTNPTLTAANGGFSIQVVVNPFTPPGSYTLVLQTSPGAGGPSSVAYLPLMVVGPGLPMSVQLTTSTPSVVMGSPAVFTVIVAGSTDGCIPTIQYQAEGVISTGWMSVPGTGQIRLFPVTPPAVGTLSVIARAFCPGSTSVMYSEQVNVTVTATAPVVPPTLPTVSAVTLTGPGTYSLGTGTGVTFTLGATATAGCTTRFAYQYSGAGLPLTTVNLAPAGLFTLFPSVQPSSLVVQATGWCAETPAVIVTSPTVNVTVGP